MRRVGFLLIRLTTLITLVVMAPFAFAATVVPDGYRLVAEAHGIPSAVFYAVAMAESGKRIEPLRAVRPWPWTLNVQGDGRSIHRGGRPHGHYRKRLPRVARRWTSG